MNSLRDVVNVFLIGLCFGLPLGAWAWPKLKRHVHFVRAEEAQEAAIPATTEISPSERVAYAQGKEAGENGASRSTNPFPKDSRLHDAWARGYSSGT